MDATRALLDSLMGADRDAGKNAKKKSFKDDDVCKHYLVWECPHDMFANTQGKVASTSPLGPCPNQHSEAMKERFQQDKEYASHRRRYLSDVQSKLSKLVDDLDVKLRRDKERLGAGNSCSKETAEVVEGGALAREMLVKEKMQAAERMAADGDMELSQKIMAEAEELAMEKHRLERVKQVADTWVDEICDVCGRQISWRAPEEIEARKHGRPHPHVMGSWHNGWLKARESLARLDEERKKAVEDNGAGGNENSRENRRRSHGRDQSQRRERDMDGVRDDERDADNSGTKDGKTTKTERYKDRRKDDEREQDGAGRRSGDRERDDAGRRGDDKERDAVGRRGLGRERDGMRQRVDSRERDRVRRRVDDRERDEAGKRVDNREREGARRRADERERDGGVRRDDNRERDSAGRKGDDRFVRDEGHVRQKESRWSRVEEGRREGGRCRDRDGGRGDDGGRQEGRGPGLRSRSRGYRGH
mmetsp:Transcript_130040/g.290418  ORF Transcript_130040/g.290418 Transcript_130040/m.290418 type:complete len:476 (+) Transcript_130040:83-1510(+)